MVTSLLFYIIAITAALKYSLHVSDYNSNEIRYFLIGTSYMFIVVLLPMLTIRALINIEIEKLKNLVETLNEAKAKQKEIERNHKIFSNLDLAVVLVKNG